MQEIAKSSVVYTLTMEDLIAFNLFHLRNSPTIRAKQRNSLIAYTLTMSLLGLVMGFVARMSWWAALCTAGACALWTAGYLLYYQKRGCLSRLRKTIRRLYSEDKNPGLFGEHTLTVDEEGVTHISAYSRTRYAWGALGRIEAEPGYTYIRLGTQTFIVRHEAIIEGDFKAVLEQIGRHYQPDKRLEKGEISE